ncbi:MAG: hypothetical protein KJ061_12475 [Vicinamibacteraceae bacterium]|nr:hypothetical protein [Vicinamibacteraceae bacterium]
MSSGPAGAPRVVVFPRSASAAEAQGRPGRFDAEAALLGVDLVPVPAAVGGWLDVLAASHERQAFAGLIAEDDEGAVDAAMAAARLGLPFHTVAGAEAARDPLLTRGRLMAADLPTPWFVVLDAGRPLEAVIDRVRLPAVVRPLDAAGPGEGVRADAVEALGPAIDRVRAAVRARMAGAPAEPAVLIEGDVPGTDIVLEGVMTRGQLLVLAIVAAPPGAAVEGGLAGLMLEAPRLDTAPLGFDDQRRMAAMVVHGALAMGLRHGPLHAECRVGEAGLFVRRIAACPMAAPWSLALRFVTASGETSTLDGLLLRSAAGGSLDGWGLAAGAR